MRLSELQRFILRESHQYRRSGDSGQKPRVPRAHFLGFYHRHVPPQSVAESITNSLERLIDHGFLIGFGRRTPAKWFIEQVQLTPLGRRAAKQALGQQQKLPLITNKTTNR